MIKISSFIKAAKSLGDTDGFGIYRLICDDTEKAFKMLRDKNISARMDNLLHPIRFLR